MARVDDPEAIKRMTAQGVGVSVLSALSVASEVDDGRLLTFPMDPQGLHRSIYLVYPRDDPLPVGAGLCPLLPPDGHSPESLIHSKVEKRAVIE